MTTTESLSFYSDQAVLQQLAQQLQQHRVSLEMTQAELSKQAGISKRSLERLESGASVQLTNFIRVLRALGLLDQLAQLTPTPSVSPMQQLRQQKKERVRASSPKKPKQDNTWSWEEEA